MPDSRVTHFQQLRERGDDAQVLRLTWSGLSWVRYGERNDLRYISKAAIVGLVHQVLEGMVQHQVNEPPVHLPLYVPEARPNPYAYACNPARVVPLCA